MRYLTFFILFFVQISFGQRLVVMQSNLTTDKTYNTYSEMVAAAVSDHDPGVTLQTLGFYSAGDGGGATYYYEGASYSGYVDTIHTTPVADGFLRFVGDLISFKQYGIRGDVVSNKTVSVTSSTVTCPTCSFTASDIGDIIYIQELFDLGAKFQASGQWDASSPYANYAALPTPGANSIALVTDPSDYSTKDTLTSEHYFVYTTTSGWVPVMHLVGGAFTITNVSSATQADINYTSPSPQAGLIASYGKDNREKIDKLADLVMNTGIEVFIGKGDYAMYRGLASADNNPFYYDDGDDSNIGERDFIIRGQGQESKLYFWCYTDTLGVVTDPTIPDNNFLGGFISYSDPRATNLWDKCNFYWENFSIEGILRTGFRNVDARNRQLLSFGLGKGRIEMDKIYARGGDGFIYHAGDWEAYYNKIFYNGMKSAETGFQNFGTIRTFKLSNSLIEDVGPFHYYTVFSRNGRGRPIYTHPQQEFEVAFTKLKNCPGVNVQFFSGGGLDAVDSTNITQYFQNVTFEWTDDSGIYASGIYSSRLAERLTLDNVNMTVSGIAGGGIRGVLINGDLKITNSNFTNINSFYVSQNVGTNNVRHPGDSTISIFMDNVSFKNSPFEISCLFSPAPRIVAEINNFDILADSLRAASQMMRFSPPINSGTPTKAIYNFRNGHIEGYLNSSIGAGLPNDVPIMFAETGDYNLDVKFTNVGFETELYPGGYGTQFMTKQLRTTAGLRVGFEDCWAPPGDTLYFDIDPSTVDPVIYGENNDFDKVRFNNGATFSHEFRFRPWVSPDTITAAATIAIEGIDYNEYYVQGATNISTINLGINGTLNRGMKGDFYLYFTEANQLNTGGNINIGSNKTISANDRVQFRPNNVTGNIDIVQITNQ